MKKFLKITAPIVSVVSFGALIVGISGVFVSMPTISIGGSSAVLPLINSFSNVYKDADLITSAGGSGVGINSILNGTKEIGMASKNPGILELGETNSKYTTWKDKNVKTLTIAWDGIGIIYKPKNPNDELNLDGEKLAKIYTAFSGVKKVTMGEILDNQDPTVIIPYARNGGSSTSGTADGFWKDSHLNYKDSNYWRLLEEEGVTDKIKSALEAGDYGTNVIQTAEANSQAWNRVKNGDVGSMIYLSSGFIINNKEEIEKMGFKIAKYQGAELSKETITNGYNWYRPFNLIFSINQIENNDSIKNMLSWIMFEDEAKKIIERDGYIPLSNEQIKTMSSFNPFDDLNLPKNKYFFIDKTNADYALKYSGARVE